MNELNDKASKITFGPEDRGFVYAVARRIVGSADDADDVTQDALLLAYRYRASFRGDAHYRTWLYRIAATTALGYLRRTKRAGLRRAANDDVATLQIADPASSPEEVMAGAESRERVRGALAKLEPKYRDVLLARADRSEIETAAELGISVANVKIRAHRARKQLRDVLETMAA